MNTQHTLDMDGWMVPIDRIVQQHACVGLLDLSPAAASDEPCKRHQRASKRNGQGTQRKASDFCSQPRCPPPTGLCSAVQPASKASCMHG